MSVRLNNDVLGVIRSFVPGSTTLELESKLASMDLHVELDYYEEIAAWPLTIPGDDTTWYDIQAKLFNYPDGLGYYIEVAIDHRWEFECIFSFKGNEELPGWGYFEFVLPMTIEEFRALDSLGQAVVVAECVKKTCQKYGERHLDITINI